jgi:hypothetical protein
MAIPVNQVIVAAGNIINRYNLLSIILNIKEVSLEILGSA